MSQLVTFQLTETDQQLLLQIARNAVRAYLSAQSPRLPDPPPGALTESRGVFVSIHRGTDLRGCIGNVHPAGPLYRSAAECAIAAAVADPRFMPLTLGDLPDVEFEISVLSPMNLVQDIREIEIGTHGLLISKKNARGLLLPQVAATQGWNRERFLQETCKKAGLKPDEWKDDATIQCFSALVFGERQFQLTATT
jgi:AmmeMemoRadiSam system protein A